MIARRLAPLLLAIALGSCNQQRADKGPVVVSAIGGRPSWPDVNRRPGDTAQRLLLDATAQGLVRFDAAGQIEPGLAERWIVVDQGRTYIFRLREAEWSNGDKVTAQDVAIVLKRAVAPASRNPLKPFLSAIDDVVAMTDQVIEVRLTRPRPDLLKLFAQPELAVLRENPPGGSGPFRNAPNPGGVGVMLRPAFDPARSPDDEAEEPGPEQNVQLIGESAARALLRFAARESDYVAGGTATDWPLIAAARIAPANVRIDPTVGLFGLAVAKREGLLATPGGRAAIAEAIDRTALIGAFTPDWGLPVERLLPDKLDSAAAPNAPAWAALASDARLADARDQVAHYRSANAGDVTLRIALPDGVGGGVLFGQIGPALVRIGVRPVRVGMNAEAELRLVDAVAPYDSARWSLATACVACSDEAQAALAAARDAPTLAERSAHIAEADAAMAADNAFIPIAAPLRWSIVSLRLKQWQPNPRAWHPLNRLRADTN